MTKPEPIDVAVELDDVTAARVDAMVRRLSRDGLVKPSDVLRTVPLMALAHVEKAPERYELRLGAKR